MVCRLCFNQSEDYIEIFSEVNISQYIQKFLELEISKQDPVSKLICKTCWQQLSSFQSFYTQIKEAQRRTHIKLKREEESAQMDGSSFEYVNTETDHDINETTEITIQNEDDYPSSYPSESEFENTSLEPVDFFSSSESKKKTIIKKRKHSDGNESLNKSDTKKRKIEHSGLEDLILKVHAENKALFHRVTREILTIKADVRKIKADLTFKQNDTVLASDRYPFTKKLPFKDRESFLKFDNDCSENSELLQTLQLYYKNEDPFNSKAFLRNNLRKLITDDAAVMFSWQGTEQKTQMKNLTVFEALRNAFREVFPKSSDMFANTILKRHFQHAMDRIRKRKIVDNSI
ncbi:uncharacterized protein LOC129921442 isoform X4 [Episyrphus balteatus]|uniref:uncharacterized protein LOC129921442 isoform X4 n=1 Tax=Episyrphus balteatus TaxID=286459 RepID=UPI002485FACC|nr:uncharacterized protein LOC129921442 isoform X4 [Episyrphus balteatus]